MTQMRLQVDTVSNVVLVNLGCGDCRLHCTTSSAGYLLLQLWNFDHTQLTRLTAALPARHYLLLAVKAQTDPKVATHELMALHQKTEHTYFSVLLKQLALRFLMGAYRFF